MSTTERPAVYHPRKPQQSAFWKLLDKYFSSFEQHDAERFAKECGDLREGFARVRCPDCRHKYLLVFGCRGRWFRPSCHSKKRDSVWRTPEGIHSLPRSPSPVRTQHLPLSSCSFQIRPQAVGQTLLRQKEPCTSFPDGAQSARWRPGARGGDPAFWRLRQANSSLFSRK
jgi:hypothetical protein